MRKNQGAIADLAEAATNTQLIEAQLLDYNKGDRLWTFFYNPQALKFSRSAKYSESETFAAKRQEIQYSNTTGATLEIGEIYMDSYCLGKSLRPLIEGINYLLEAKLEKNEFAPPLLSFVFGSRRFAPCVLARLDWQETAWLGGEPARVTMSMTLMEAPRPISRTTSSTALPEVERFETPHERDKGPRLSLTERQQADAKKQAEANLKANLSKLSTETQNLIRSKAYSLTVDPNTGDVDLLNAKKTKVGRVGRWDGKVFTAEAIATLPLKT